MVMDVILFILFILSWTRVRRMRRGSLSSEQLMCGGGVRSILLLLVEDTRGDHMKEVYSRAGLITALYVAMSVSFCLLHPVAVTVFYDL